MVRLLRARRERPCRGRAEQRNEIAAFQLIELHSVPCQPGPNCSISKQRWSVRGYEAVCTTCQLLAKPVPGPLWLANIGFFVGDGLSSVRPE